MLVLANIAELKKQAAACRSKSTVSAEDKKVIDTWLAKLQDGKHEVPDVVTKESWPIEKTTKAEIQESILNPHYKYAFQTKFIERLTYRVGDETVLAAAFSGKKVRLVEVDFSKPDGDDCEDCKVNAWLVFGIDDKGEIVGLGFGEGHEKGLIEALEE